MNNSQSDNTVLSGLEDQDHLSLSSVDISL